MPFAKVSQDFSYKVSYKNPSPALPIYPTDFVKFSVLSLILGVSSKRLKYIDKLSWVLIRVAFTAKLFFPLRCYAP